MKREVYEALKERMAASNPELGVWGWEFDNIGLNVGYGCFDEGYIDIIHQNMRTKNVWNASQRLYKHLLAMCPDIDARLLAVENKKYPVEIRRKGLHPSCTEAEMTLQEVNAKRRELMERFSKNYRWTDFWDGYSHVVFCIRYNDRFNIYEGGWLMTDEEFEKTMYDRKDVDVQRVWAFHRR